MSTPVVVAFGANLGDPRQQISRGLILLADVVAIKKVSGFYESAPMYNTDQPPFLNGAVLGTTESGPINLVKALKAIEAEVGREEREKNGPRELDLDLIVYGSSILSSNANPKITVPHTKLAERRFVLEPLAEIAPDLIVPGMGDVTSLLQGTDDQAGDVRRVGDADISLPS